MPEGKGIPEQTPDGETAHETNLLQSFVPQLATQPADIEVGYPPDLHPEKKNYQEYLLELLMKFLAVTIWVFAGNIREHLPEKTNTKEYLETYPHKLLQQQGLLI